MRVFMRIDCRFKEVTTEKVFALATLLDPRYKGRLFSTEELSVVKQWALDEARLPTTAAPTTDAVADEPPAKRAKIGAMEVLGALLGPTTANNPSTAVAAAETELAVYLQADVIQTTESPTAWWAANAARFPTLANEAKRYLSAPPTSVESERLFSSSALIYTDRRSRLLPKRADMLLFLKHNLPLINYKYSSA